MVWAANHFGYGNSFRWFNYAVVRTLLDLGINTRVLRWEGGYTDPSVRFPQVKDDADIQRSIAIINARWMPPPDVETRLERHAAMLFGYFQCEGTLVDSTTAKWFEGFDAMLATSEVTKQAMLDSGVRIPIHIFGHGIDPEVLTYTDRPLGRRPYTFFHLADVQKRKGTDILLKAFHVVKKNRDVRLHIKAQSDTVRLFAHDESKEYRKGGNDPKIVWDTNNYTAKEMAALFGQMDCGVFPSRSEGFGLPPLEFEATGGPAIATDAFGFKDTSSKGRIPLVVERWSPALFDAGLQAEPSLDHLVYLMEKCADDPAWAKEMGKKASQNAHQNWTWKAKVRELLTTLRKYGATA